MVGVEARSNQRKNERVRADAASKQPRRLSMEYGKEINGGKRQGKMGDATSIRIQNSVSTQHFIYCKTTLHSYPS